MKLKVWLDFIIALFNSKGFLALITFIINFFNKFQEWRGGVLRHPPMGALCIVPNLLRNYLIAKVNTYVILILSYK